MATEDDEPSPSAAHRRDLEQLRDMAQTSDNYPAPMLSAKLRAIVEIAESMLRVVETRERCREIEQRVHTVLAPLVAAQQYKNRLRNRPKPTARTPRCRLLDPD